MTSCILGSNVMSEEQSPCGQASAGGAGRDGDGGARMNRGAPVPLWKVPSGSPFSLNLKVKSFCAVTY